MSEDALVLSEKLDGGVAVVSINRPEVRNALNTPTRQALAAAFTAIHDDESVRAVVLTGKGDNFAAGADLNEFINADPVEMYKRRSERYWNAIAATPQPVIAAINGFALGGGLEVAMACDILIAGESARVGQPEVRVGIMCGAGGTQRLTRAVGKFEAMRMCLTGKPITAADAHRIGLVSEVVADDELLDTAVSLARGIAALPPLAVMQTKESVLQAANTSLEAGLAFERKAFQTLFASEDKKEGMTAFFEKRKPDFKGQ